MAEITAKEVKRLRDATGAGMMDCKKALIESDGDFDKAVEELRKKGLAKAAEQRSAMVRWAVAEVPPDAEAEGYGGPSL